jgi:flagellum-specific peptidoglycan hydrolase FlgJ
MTPLSFIIQIKPGADRCEIEKGIPAAFTVAQAALESAWGESGLTKKACNLFGIKASKGWTGPTVTMMTDEVIKGQRIRVPATWRSYESWADCLLDHAEFFHVNPRYAKALQFPHDGHRFAIEAQAAGYATDPLYAEKIINIIRHHNL